MPAISDALAESGIELNRDLIEECECTAAIRYIQDDGYSVPQNIEIGGFDNIPLSSPQRTTVAQPIDRMAQEAVRQLIRKIQNSRVRNRDII